MLLPRGRELERLRMCESRTRLTHLDAIHNIVSQHVHVTRRVQGWALPAKEMLRVASCIHGWPQPRWLGRVARSSFRLIVSSSLPAATVPLSSTAISVCTWVSLSLPSRKYSRRPPPP